MKYILFFLLGGLLLGCGGSSNSGSSSHASILSAEWDSQQMAIKLYTVDTSTGEHSLAGTLPEKPNFGSLKAGIVVHSNYISNVSMTVRRIDGSLLLQMDGAFPATISQNGQWLVYYTDDGGFVSHPDGSGASKLPFNQYTIAVFNDGMRFLTTDDSGNLSIFKKDGSDPVRITPFILSFVSPIILSPDERTIVASFTTDERKGLVALDVIDGSLRVLSNPSSDRPYFEFLAFSNDGKSLFHVEPGDYHTVPSSLHRIDLATRRDSVVGPFSLNEVLLSPAFYFWPYTGSDTLPSFLRIKPGFEFVHR